MCTVSIPLERDEGDYAYVAQRMLQGEVPYRDVFDQKPPGVYLAYLPAVALFGTSVEAIHLNVYLWSALTAVFLYLIALLLAGELAAAFSVLIFSIISAAPEWTASAANTEHFMLLPLTAALWAALRATRGQDRRWWAASGALAMAALWFKQVAILEWPLLLGLPWLIGAVRTPRETLKDAGAFALGIAAIALPVPLVFLAAGAWKEFLDCVFLHNLSYVQVLTPGESLAALGHALASQAGGFWPVWLAALVSLWAGLKDDQSAFVGWVWLALAFSGAAAGRYFMPHYFIQIAPALAFTAALTAAKLSKKTPAAAVVALLLIAVPVAASWGFWSAGSDQARSELLYPGNLFSKSARVAEHIASRSGSEDRVLVFGSEPQLLFLAKRPSATRYILFYPLMMPSPRTLERQEAAWAEIERSQPRYLVLADMKASWLPDAGAPSFIREKVLGLRKSDYRMDGVVWQDESGIFEGFTPEAAAPYARAAAQGKVRAALLLFRREAGPDVQQP